MINIAKLLKDAPEGMKLYSPLFGEVKFKYLNGSKFGIVVEDFEECCRSFDKYGRYFTDFPNAECLLFPSKDCRTWEGWKLPVEPKFKFKVGDWIVQSDNGTVSQITKTINGKDEYGEYRAYEHTNGYFAECFENEYHLWTIQDAKDGDVLVTTKIRSCPFIYRKTDRKNNLAYYYAGIDGNGDFSEGCLKRTLFHFGSVSCVVPATKEQRDLLFAEMKKAGYKWDAEKKELKKLKPHYDISNFKPFDKVLVRDYNSEDWYCGLFSHYSKINTEDNLSFITVEGCHRQCVPYEGNEHLLGTSDMSSEEFINW